MLKVINKLSQSGETLAIWNDATRCIDLHDVTAIALDSRAITFYEVKEGSVNEEIIQIANASNESEIQSGVEELFARRGGSGLRELERVARQPLEGVKLHTLATNDDVQDPFLKIQRIAIFPHKPLERYDAELSELLKEARRQEFASITVDGCLHILAVNQARKRDGISIDALIERELKNRMTNPGVDEPDCREVMVAFQNTIYSPISMPVMIRPLEALDIADICIGNMVLFFMFDMNAWGKHFQECRLSWSSEKEGRRERSKPFLERRMVVDCRMPIVTSPSGNSLQLGDRILALLVCEGIRPVSMAQQYDYQLTHQRR